MAGYIRLGERYPARFLGYRDGKRLYAGDCVSGIALNKRYPARLVGYKDGKRLYAGSVCLPVTTPRVEGRLIGYKDGKRLYAWRLPCCASGSSGSGVGSGSGPGSGTGSGTSGSKGGSQAGSQAGSSGSAAGSTVPTVTTCNGDTFPTVLHITLQEGTRILPFYDCSVINGVSLALNYNFPGVGVQQRWCATLTVGGCTGCISFACSDADGRYYLNLQFSGGVCASCGDSTCGWSFNGQFVAAPVARPVNITFTDVVTSMSGCSPCGCTGTITATITE